MPRPKAWWKGTLYAFGPRHTGGKVDGFHIAVDAEDGTRSGRLVDLELSDVTVPLLLAAMNEYMARDRSKDAGRAETEKENETP